MRKLSKILAVLIPAISISYAHATVRVINFDTDAQGNTITHGQIVDNEYANWGVNITSVATKDPENPIQVAFDTRRNNTSDDDLEFSNNNNVYNQPDHEFGYTALEIDGTTFGTPLSAEDSTITPGNVLLIQNVNKRTPSYTGNQLTAGCDVETCIDPDDQAKPAGYFEFTFDFLVDIVSLDTFDFEEDEVTEGVLNRRLLTAQFFDENDQEIPVGYVFEAMIDGGFKRQNVSVNDVQRLVLNLPGSGAIDNLVYKTAEVSAPATLGLLGLSLLFISRRVNR